MNKNIKISFSLLLVFALMLALCGCSAKAKGVTPLPGGCEIERIGSGVVDWLEGPHLPAKWTVDELRAIRDDYRRKLRELLKARRS